VEIVGRCLEALNRRDFDAWLEFFHPDVEAHDFPTVPDVPVIHGREELRKWAEMQAKVWTDESYYEPESFTASGDFVIIAIRAHGWGRGSRAPVEFSFFQVCEMREGKIQRAWASFDKGEALEAAGLSE
jgi:ketosteroid isomerase-like protein